MLISWDERKDEEHKEKRGVGFSYVSDLLRKKHAVLTVEEYPHQLRLVGALDRKYWTLVIEHCEDEYGSFVWCSNFWESTKGEKEYARYRGVL